LVRPVPEAWARPPEAVARAMDDLSGKAQSPETEGGWLSRERVLALVLLVATGLAVYVCYRLARPFLPALAWALALAVVAHPLHDWIERRLRRANLAAGVAVVLVAVAIVGPTVLLTQRLGREVAWGVGWVQSEYTSGHWRAALERHPWLATVLSWFGGGVDVGGAAERLLSTLSSNIPSALTGSVWAVAELLITLFALFYFFRDRRPALRALRSLVPLSEAEVEEVFRRVTDTIYAIVYGTLTVALVQGLLGGLMFWVLGLPAALLWGAVMALLAVVPVLGAFVVWAPAALFLALTGSWGKAIVLTVWGVGVVSLIDNLLYPILVGKRLRLHTLVVFIAIVGGVPLLGSAGVILGPAALAVTVALVDIWRRRTSGGRAAETGVNV
jgi:predicted PurR-regulated permease PerM